MRNVIIFAVAALIIAGAVGRYAESTGLSGPASAARKPAAAARTSSPSANTLIVPGDRRGHFRVTAVVGGSSVDFLVDTGASIIALTHRDAGRLGIHPAQSEFKLAINTANGTMRAAKARLASVAVGPLVVHDVMAVVMPDGALSQNLLGMSFLSRLKRFEFRTGQLVLEQ